MSQRQYQYQYSKVPLDSNTSNNTNIAYSHADARKKETIADRLVSIFKNPQYKEFYCRVAWKLSEATIWQYVEEALDKGRDPAKYFSFLCKKAGV